MATKLNSTLHRESSLTVDDREIVVSLNEDQTVSLKLKGMKSGTVQIGIRELWYYLNAEEDSYTTDMKSWNPDDDDEVIAPPKKVIAKNCKGDEMISIKELRSLNAVTSSDLDITVKLDELCVDLLNRNR
jgi:hypothetical protein